jgi:uncharacterized RDD family membrane protein YckC
MTHADRPRGLPDPVADARFYEGVAPRRLAAFLMDGIAATALGLLAGTAVGLATFGGGFVAMGPVAFVVAFLYRAVAVARVSATPGMWAAGIELRDLAGARVSPATAWLHTAVYLGCWAFVIPQIVSVFLMATARDGRGLPDLVAGTAAIHRPA